MLLEATMKVDYHVILRRLLIGLFIVKYFCNFIM